MPKLTEIDVPLLEGGWVNLTEAAGILGVTRSYVYKLAARPADQGGLATLRRVGNQAVYVVQASELEERKAQRAKEAESPEAEARELTLEELYAATGT